MSFILESFTAKGLTVDGDTTINGDVTMINGSILHGAIVDSPLMTGIPLVPTAVEGTNSDQASSTKFVGSAIAIAITDLVNSAPGTLDTLKEIADALGDDPNFAATMTTALGNRLRVDINNQNLNSSEQLNGRTNLGLSTVAATGSFADLVGIPNIVNTFNTRHGDITLSSTDVTNALGFIPANKAGDTFTGLVKMAPTTGSIGQSAANAGTLAVVSNGTAGDAAFMSFSRPGAYSAYFGLDTDNQWKVGGWSGSNVSYLLYHSGNLSSAPFVQNGTGIGQNANQVKLGWNVATSKLKATVDTTDLGNIALESYAANKAGDTFTGAVKLPSGTNATLSWTGATVGSRIQLFDLLSDSAAYMGSGFNMGGGPYEHSIFFPKQTNGVLKFGTYDGTTFAEKMRLNQDGSLSISNHTAWHTGNLTNVSQLANDAGYITAATANVTSVFGRTGAIVMNSGDVTTALGFTPVNAATVAAANGIATLDGTGKLTTAQIPASLVGAVVYQGVWDASTNTPTLQSGVGVKGNYYKVSVQGNTNIDGNASWNVNDTIIFDGTVWDKISGASGSSVTSVFGKAGVVTVTPGDITGALGFTPYNSTNPSSYITVAGARSAISVSGNLSYNSATGVISYTTPVTTVAGRTGDVTLSVGDVLNAAPLSSPAFTGFSTFSGQASTNQAQVNITGTSGALSQIAKLRFNATFGTGSDTASRLVSSIRSGFTGTYGSEYLDFYVNNANNDAAADGNQSKIASIGIGGLNVVTGNLMEAGSRVWTSTTLTNSALTTALGYAPWNPLVSNGFNIPANVQQVLSGTFNDSSGNYAALFNLNESSASNQTGTVPLAYRARLLQINTLATSTAWPLAIGVKGLTNTLTIDQNGAFRYNGSPSTTTNSTGSVFSVITGAGGSSGGTVSGALTLATGAASGNGTGVVNLVTGNDSSTGVSGAMNINTGSSAGGGTGNLTIQTGADSVSGTTGTISLNTGVSTSGTTGNINLNPGGVTIVSVGGNSGLTTINKGIALGGPATLGATVPQTFSYENPITRFYIGDGTGYQFAFSKRVGSVTTDLFNLNDNSGIATFNNSVNINGTLTMNNTTSGIELGSTSATGTPYVDFHSSGNNIDYDARIIGSGGSGTVGAGTLTYNATQHTFNGIVGFNSNPTLNGSKPALLFLEPAGSAGARNWTIANEFSGTRSALNFYLSNAKNGDPQTAGTAKLSLDYQGHVMVNQTVSVGGAAFQVGGSASITQTLSLGDKLTGTSAAFSGDVQAMSFNGGKVAYRNAIINGGFEVQQRVSGSAQNIPSTLGYPQVDRWAFQNSTAAVSTVARNLFGTNTYGLRWLETIWRNSGATAVSTITMLQALETANSAPLAGQTVTLSFYAQAGANFSAASSLINVALVAGTGLDQSSASMFAGTWSGTSNLVSSNATLQVGVWNRYTYSASVPAGTTQLGVQFQFTPVGTAGTYDYFQIAGVQLEVGSVPTPYEIKPIDIEQLLCYRYFYQAGVANYGCSGPTNGVSINLDFPVTMRTVPTVTTTLTDANFVSNASPTGTQWALVTPGVKFATKSSGTISIAPGATTNSGSLNLYGMVFDAQYTAIQGYGTFSANAEL